MSMDNEDYATFARIEDHLRRIADALEMAHPKPGTYIPPRFVGEEMDRRDCDDAATAIRDGDELISEETRAAVLSMTDKILFSLDRRREEGHR